MRPSFSTEFLLRELLAALGAPLAASAPADSFSEDMSEDSESQPLPTTSSGRVMMVRRTSNVQHTMTLVDRNFEIEAFVPSHVTGLLDQTLGYKTLGRLRGSVVRVDKYHFFTLKRCLHTEGLSSSNSVSRPKIYSSIARVYMWVEELSIVDDNDLAIDNKTMIYAQPLVQERLCQLSDAELEKVLMIQQGLPPMHTETPGGLFDDNRPLMEEDCVIPEEQEQELEQQDGWGPTTTEREPTDSELIEENGMVPMTQSQSYREGRPHTQPSVDLSATLTEETESQKYPFQQENIHKTFVIDEGSDTEDDEDEERKRSTPSSPKTPEQKRSTPSSMIVDLTQDSPADSPVRAKPVSQKARKRLSLSQAMTETQSQTQTQAEAESQTQTEVEVALSQAEADTQTQVDTVGHDVVQTQVDTQDQAETQTQVDAVSQRHADDSDMQTQIDAASQSPGQSQTQTQVEMVSQTQTQVDVASPTQTQTQTHVELTSQTQTQTQTDMLDRLQTQNEVQAETPTRHQKPKQHAKEAHDDAPHLSEPETPVPKRKEKRSNSLVGGLFRLFGLGASEEPDGSSQGGSPSHSSVLGGEEKKDAQQDHDTSSQATVVLEYTVGDDDANAFEYDGGAASDNGESPRRVTQRDHVANKPRAPGSVAVDVSVADEESEAIFTPQNQTTSSVSAEHGTGFNTPSPTQTATPSTEKRTQSNSRTRSTPVAASASTRPASPNVEHHCSHPPTKSPTNKQTTTDRASARVSPQRAKRPRQQTRAETQSTAIATTPQDSAACTPPSMQQETGTNAQRSKRQRLQQRESEIVPQMVSRSATPRVLRRDQRDPRTSGTVFSLERICQTLGSLTRSSNESRAPRRPRRDWKQYENLFPPLNMDRVRQMMAEGNE